MSEQSVICCYHDAGAFRRYLYGHSVFRIHFKFIRLSVPECSDYFFFYLKIFPTKILYTVVPCHECCMCCPSHPSLFHRPYICVCFSPWVTVLARMLNEPETLGGNMLCFLLNALHVSDYISSSSGATFISCTSHWYMPVRLVVSHTTARRMVPAYADIKLSVAWTIVIQT